MKHTELTFTELVNKIETNRFFDLPRMVREAFRRLLSRVESLEDSPSGGIESITGDYVDNTDPLNPILNDPRPYKVYTALLTQSGSDAPVAIVLENTLGKIHWSRRFKGTYEGSLARAFTENKTTIQIIAHTGQGYTTNSSAVNKDVVEISTSNELDRTADNVLENTPIEIRVYN